ncbi:MAG: alkaline phosphatase family protein [Cytophagales bacterium]|nr:alkaline phosphatase family protein [Cytophagales bacterium]
MKRLIVLSLLISHLGFGQKKKAIVILVDGIPHDVIEKVATPNIDRIAAEGAFAEAYVGGEKGGESESPTISAVGYNSMLTGTWANKHNVWGNSIKKPNYAYPTFFKVAREQKPDLSLGIFSTWEDNRTKLLGEGLEATGKLRLDVKFDGYENDTLAFPHRSDRLFIKNIDKYVTQKAVETIKAEAPDISWVYLEFTDDMGHKFGDSEQFYSAVAFTDSLIGEIYDATQSRTEEEWFFAVTTDHGRSADTGKNHGGQSDRERKTWILTNQPKVNERFTNGLAIVDIFPSLLKYMDIDIPQSVEENLDGQPFLK